ncbi:MAG: HTH domain-containing protein [Ignavibacteriales bacterium]|nr:HTH domain-containing protein [Ignavibacteriales bacterium]
MDITKQILDAMKKSGKPMSAGQLAEATGVDRKEIDKAMKILKTEAKISSPKNCYWEPAK